MYNFHFAERSTNSKHIFIRKKDKAYQEKCMILKIEIKI